MRRNRNTAESIRAKLVVQDDGCHTWPHRSHPNGYGYIRFEGRQRLLHRVVWELTHGPIPPGLLVLHSCDVRHCANIEHLRLGTAYDNAQDAIKRKRFAGHTIRLPHQRINWEDVDTIRAARAAGRSVLSLANEYAVSRPTIHRVIDGFGFRDEWREDLP